MSGLKRCNAFVVNNIHTPRITTERREGKGWQRAGKEGGFAQESRGPRENKRYFNIWDSIVLDLSIDPLWLHGPSSLIGPSALYLDPALSTSVIIQAACTICGLISAELPSARSLPEGNMLRLAFVSIVRRKAVMECDDMRLIGRMAGLQLTKPSRQLRGSSEYIKYANDLPVVNWNLNSEIFLSQLNNLRISFV